MLQFLLRWTLAALLLNLSGFLCASVHILTQQPVHVVPGSSLVLKARIEMEPIENISMLTWEREPETGTDSVRVTLARCLGRKLRCAGTRPNVFVDLQQREVTLQMDGYRQSDGGVHALTVTDQQGVRSTAHCIVREYEAVHHVSVSINVSHSMLVCGEAWGTDPTFKWLHDTSPVPQTVGKVSRDGTQLLVTATPICGRFTCTVSNKLSYSSATYAAAPCGTEAGGTKVAVAAFLLVLLLCCSGGLAFLLRRRCRRSIRGERLQEHSEDI